MRCGNSSVGRAQPCQGWGREFESRFPLQIFYTSDCQNLSNAGIAQLVEHNLAKVGVASSSLVSRSKFFSSVLPNLIFNPRKEILSFFSHIF